MTAYIPRVGPKTSYPEARGAFRLPLQLPVPDFRGPWGVLVGGRSGLEVAAQLLPAAPGAQAPPQAPHEEQRPQPGLQGALHPRGSSDSHGGGTGDFLIELPENSTESLGQSQPTRWAGISRQLVFGAIADVYCSLSETLKS